MLALDEFQCCGNCATDFSGRFCEGFAGSLFIDDFHSSRCYGAAAAPILFLRNKFFGYYLSVLDQFYFPVGKAYVPDGYALYIIVILSGIRNIASREVVENHRKRTLAIRPEYGFSVLPDFVGRVLFIRVCFHGIGVMGGFRRPDSNY